jgi:hypothetical protein
MPAARALLWDGKLMQFWAMRSPTILRLAPLLALASVVAASPAYPADESALAAAILRQPLAELYTHTRPPFVMVYEATYSQLAPGGGARRYCVRLVLIDPAADSAPRRKVVHALAVFENARGQPRLSLAEGEPTRLCAVRQGRTLSALSGRRIPRR